MVERELLAAIRHLGGLLDDLEATRIANGNRIAAAQREFGDSFGLDAIQAHIASTEHQVELELCRLWRRHPLAGWAKGVRGAGEKSVARLVAAIGDPYLRGVGHWETVETPRSATGSTRLWVIDGYEPRSAGQLFAFCGHGDPVRSQKRKGMTQAELFKAGNPRAKKQVWMIATGLLKAETRDAYDRERERVAAKLHEASCVRCGPAGRPALPGTPWSKAHQHASGLRVLGRWFLLELWLAAAAVHGADAPPEAA